MAKFGEPDRRPGAQLGPWIIHPVGGGIGCLLIVLYLAMYVLFEPPAPGSLDSVQG